MIIFYQFLISFQCFRISSFLNFRDHEKATAIFHAAHKNEMIQISLNLSE